MQTPNCNDSTSSVSCGLSAADFTRIAANGFGDPQNAYCHAMTYFQDQVFVGTTRHSMALLKLFPPRDAPAMDPWPVKVPDRVQDLDMRGQIWRWDPKAKEWDKVLTSPVISGRGGQEAPRDLGYRGMIMFQGRSDSQPALYVATMSTVLRGTAALILRSEDGLNFSPVSEPGLGNPNVSTFRSMATFDDHLYVPPTGEGVHFNSNRASVLLRSADPGIGQWEVACEPGFGDPTNSGIFEMAVFNSHLYAGTFNHFHGYQIWKTPATGSDRTRWTKVIERGAYRGELSEIAMSMCVFDGALYVGSAIQNGGYDRTNQVGPASGEIIRIYPDDSWDLVVGSPRRTPDGVKVPLSGMGPGFDNIFAGYIWRMVVHDGWLYVSTFDWSVFLPYARRPSAPARRLMQQVGMEQIVRHGGGFDLWRTRDGINWVPVTRNGLGNPYNYGARNFVSTPQGLFVGTANPFGPEVAAQLASGWTYIANPDGGAEVWLGKPIPPPGERTVDGRGDGQLEVHQARASRRSSVGKRAATIEVVDPASTSDAQSAKAARVLVTGATGFVGSRVLEKLLVQEDRIRAFDLPAAVQDLQQSGRVEVVAGSLDEDAKLVEALEGIQMVYHLAGRLPGSTQAELMQVNVRGTEKLLQACHKVGSIERFVFTSSAAVYADLHSPEEWPLTEFSPLWPRGRGSLQAYGHSKVLAERLIRWYASDADFAYVVLRPSIAYGLGSRFVEDMVRQILADRGAGSGPNARSILQFIHVRDLADAIVKAGTQRDVQNEIFNLAGTEAVTYQSFADLVRRLAGEVGLRAEPFVRSRIWERYIQIHDTSAAQRKLGFLPRVTLQEGVAELLAAIEPSDSWNRQRDFDHGGWFPAYGGWWSEQTVK